MSEQEDFEFRLRMEREAAPQSSTPAPSASMGDVIAGTPIARLAMGAASPLIGAAQLGAHVGDAANRAMGVEPVVSPWIDAQIARYKAAKERGMKASGTEGYDWHGLLGSFAPGAMMAKGIGAALPQATSVLGRAGVGAVQGGAAAAAQPVEQADEGFWGPKAGQAALGTVMGGTVPLAIDAGKGIGKVITQAAQPFTEKGRAAILQDFRHAIMGQDPAAKARMIQESANAKPGVGGVMPTVGEVTSSIPESTGLAAHQADIAKLTGNSTEFAKRLADQQTARADVLAPIARNEGALEGEKAIRDTITGPMREKVLGAVNQQGDTYRTIADKLNNLKGLSEKNQQIVNELSKPSINRTLVSSGPSDALRTAVDIHAPYAPPELRSSVEKVAGAHLESRFAETVANQSKSRGIAQSNVGALNTMQDLLERLPTPAPLKASTLVSQLNRTLQNPEVQGSPYTQKALASIRDHIEGMADEHGVVDARSLYQFKKEGVNQLIDATMDKTNPKFAEKFRAKELVGIKKSIDNAIEGAGGTGWKDYLQKYQELSAGINQMEAAQELQKALTNPLGTGETGSKFSDALKTVDMSSLSGKEHIALRKVAEELSRYDAFKKLVPQTSLSGKDAIPGDLAVPLPNLLYRPAMIANFMMKHVAKGAEEKIGKMAAQQYLNPPAFAAAMQSVPPRYQPMIEALMRQAPTAAGTMAGRTQ